MSVSVSLTGSIKATDSVSGTISLSKVLTALVTPGTAWTEAQALAIGTSPTSVTLPISPVTFVYLKNTHATQTLTVAWTPNGGSSNTVVVLQPGSYISFGETVQATSGVTTITLTGSGAGTTVEYIIGG